MRLPHELKDLFRDWLAAHYPLRAQSIAVMFIQAFSKIRFRQRP